MKTAYSLLSRRAVRWMAVLALVPALTPALALAQLAPPASKTEETTAPALGAKP